jgi:hypothetical protein
MEGCIIQLLCVKSQTEGSFDTGAESLGVTYME